MRNLKKVVALIAVFAMMVSTVAFAQSFTDVSEEHDAYEAIEMLSNLGILTGDDQDGDGKMDFRPGDPITRAEVAAVMSRIQGINGVSQASTQFTDVPQSHWASGYVAQAAGQGIVNGYGDGNFGPEDNITVEQAIKMVMVTIGYEPFAADNGGYPTGYQTAAQRYGVLKDVTGAAAGTEATRGTIAQLVYNAIDTTLMDRYTYGADAEYVIYDGKGDYPFMTLLTRNLGVKKYTGVVTANAVTSIGVDEDGHYTGAAADINTEDEEEVWITPDDTDDNYYYEVDEIETVYANGTNAGELIAKHVEVYVKEAAKKGEYNIISIAATNKNKTTTIALDAYQGYDAEEDVIEYRKNDTDSRNTTVKVEADAVVFLNGVYFGTVDGLDGSALDNDNLVNSAWSGEIVVLDNGVDTYANSVFFNIATAGVIDEVSASGQVTFKEDIYTVDGDKIQLYFDEEDYDQIIVLEKNGEAVDYTELVEWDVLSILATENGYYVVNVIDEGKIDGTITQRANSETSAYPFDDEVKKEYTINGTAYDVANYAYINGELEPGAAGTFYIDNYGKIVAYDKNGTTVVSDNYAYVLNVAPVEDDWGKGNLKIQVLAKDGNVYEGFLAEKVKVEFPAAVGLSAADLEEDTLGDDVTIDVAKLAEDSSVLDNLAAVLKNELITYAANSTGEFKTITFAQDNEDETSLYLGGVEGASVEYDAEDSYIRIGTGKKLEVNEDSIVFFISNADGDVYTGGSVSGQASKSASKVATAAALSDGEVYDYARIYNTQEGEAEVIVLFNTAGGISSSSNIAVIDKVGEAVYNGEEAVAVTYYMGGVACTSYAVDGEYADELADLLAADQGSIWKFAVSADGTTITEGKEYGAYDRDEFIANAGAAQMTFTTGLKAKEGLKFGPVTEYVSGKKTIRIAPAIFAVDDEETLDVNEAEPTNVFGTATFYDFTDFESLPVAEANVYVFDPNKAKNKLSIGTPSDASADKTVIKQAVYQQDDDDETIAFPIVSKDDDSIYVDVDELALGMMDFVAAFEYDEDVVDIVIYKAYDFGKYNTEFAD